MCKSSLLVWGCASTLPRGRANYTALAGTAGRHLPLVRNTTSHPHAAWCVRQLRARPASGGGAVRTRHHGHLTEGDVQAGHAPYDSTTGQAASTTGITLSDEGGQGERARSRRSVLIAGPRPSQQTRHITSRSVAFACQWRGFMQAITPSPANRGRPGLNVRAAGSAMGTVFGTRRPPAALP